MQDWVYNSEDEAYAHFLKTKNNELQAKIQKAEHQIRQYKMQQEDNENNFGYTKKMFPEVFI